jgi:glycosyltransferase involved in cell wall biosynthesis
MILTYNEAPNIARTLERLGWAREIVVIDSGSTDGTLDILAQRPNVRVLSKEFESFATQCNFGLHHIHTPWVLSLDADYVLSEDLVAELGTISPAAENSGYRASFVSRIHGKALRGSLYPPRVVLYRRERAVYRDDGHAHRVQIDGIVLPLKNVIYHDDRKPLSRWIKSQHIYARQEAEYLLHEQQALSAVDRLRLLAWPAPLLVFFYTLFWKGCALDGWAGWYYTLQRTYWEICLALELLERRLSSMSSKAGHG